MLRRSIVSIAGGITLGAAIPVRALIPGRTYRIGWLGYTATNTAQDERVLAVFRQRLRELGFIEGGNLLIIWRYAEGRMERYDDFAAEMLRLGVDLVIATSNVPALAVMKVSRELPIVHISASDPVRSGLVASLAHPGGQNTGIASLSTDLVLKRIELLKAAIPTATRVTMVRCVSCALSSGQSAASIATRFEGYVAAARALGISLQLVDVSAASDFDAASATLRRERPDALMILPNPVTVALREQFHSLAAALRVPTFGSGVRYGDMLAYDPDWSAIFRRTAEFIARILDGAKPGDLPMEQPSVFEFVIDLKIAKTLGLTIPQAVLLQATEVIE